MCVWPRFPPLVLEVYETKRRKLICGKHFPNNGGFNVIPNMAFNLPDDDFSSRMHSSRQKRSKNKRQTPKNIFAFSFVFARSKHNLIGLNTRLKVQNSLYLTFCSVDFSLMLLLSCCTCLYNYCDLLLFFFSSFALCVWSSGIKLFTAPVGCQSFLASFCGCVGSLKNLRRAHIRGD